MFWWRADGDGLTRAVTDRHDGVSAGRYGSLNLGGQVGDDPVAVRANRHTVAAALGLAESRLVFMRQCHSARVEVLEGPWSGAVPDCDGVVTTATGLALAVLSADCVPVLLTDSRTGAIAPALDLAAGVAAQLSRAGVRVQRLPGCTREDADLYSHRGAAGGPTGRFATIVLRYAAPAGP